MSGCLKKMLAFLGVLVLLVGIAALLFWLKWRHDTQLLAQAREAYYNGEAETALALYQEYVQVFGLEEEEVKSLQRGYIDELQDFLKASELAHNGQVEEAVVAYETFLEDHFHVSPAVNPYFFQARQALSDLNLGQARQRYESGEYEKAIEIYATLLSPDPLVDEDYPLQGYKNEAFYQEAERTQSENRTAALNEVQVVWQDWAQTLGQAGNTLKFVETCEVLIKDHPEILYTPTGVTVQASLEEARRALPAWLEANPAVPELVSPAELSPDSEGYWNLTTCFVETGGKVGYTLSGSGWIVTQEGEKYGTWGSIINRGEVVVEAGGEAEDTYRFSGEIFIGGEAVFTWDGNDLGGHPITLEERVRLLP